MTIDQMANEIFDLMDMMECFEFYGTVEEAIEGIKDSIVNDPQGVIAWLLDRIRG